MTQLQACGIVGVVSYLTVVFAIVASAMWINHSITEVRFEVAEMRIELAQGRFNTNKVIAESESNTIKVIGELRGEIGVLSTQMDSLKIQMNSLEGKVEGINDYLRNRDNQTAPKDASTLDLEKSPL